jgi:hypothetical protein
MKLFKLSKDFPRTIYSDESLYYVWIYNPHGFDYLMCTSIYAIAYAVSYIELRKRLRRGGSYYYVIFKGKSLRHVGYWTKGFNKNGKIKIEFIKY